MLLCWPARALMPRATSIDQGTFASFISSAELVLLRIGSSYPMEIDGAVIEYLDAEYPSRFAFGVLNRRSIKTDVWWEKHFGPIVSALRLGQPRDGFYLFYNGEPRTWHSGARDPATMNGGEVAVSLLLLSLAHASGTMTRNDIDALLGHLEAEIQKLLSGRARDEGPPEEGHGSEGATADPYKVLGLSPDASDAELKEAYRRAISANHPDKVAHLSPEIQRFAEARTKAIQAAYDSIRRLREDSRSGDHAENPREPRNFAVRRRGRRRAR